MTVAAFWGSTGAKIIWSVIAGVGAMVAVGFVRSMLSNVFRRSL